MDPAPFTQLDRLGGELRERIRRGVFPSVRALVAAIKDYIDEHNLAPKPFIWTAKASDLLAKVSRAKAALSDNSPSV